MTSPNATLDLALRDEPQAVMLTNPQLTVIANTDFVPKGIRGNVPAVLACVARGRSMGIPDMVALNGISIINGKATLSAELMVAIVREHGHSITGEVTTTSAKVRGRRRDNGDAMTAEFSMAMAKEAGLLELTKDGKKTPWHRFPDDMMWARAVSKLCRRLFADCFAGGTYTDEEASDLTADEVLDDRPADSPIQPDVDAGDGGSPQTPSPPYEPLPDEADVPGNAILAAGEHEGKTLQQVYDLGDDGIDYLKRLLAHWTENSARGTVVVALSVFADAHPELQP